MMICGGATVDRLCTSVALTGAVFSWREGLALICLNKRLCWLGDARGAGMTTVVARVRIVASNWVANVATARAAAPVDAAAADMAAV